MSKKHSKNSHRLKIAAPLLGIVCIIAGIVIGNYAPKFNWLNKKNAEPTVVDASKTISVDDYVVTTQTVKDIIKPASSLITTKYYYTDADTAKNSKELFNVTLPFTTNEVVFTYDGVISIGIDLQEVQYEIDNEAKTIDITLPDIQVISNEIDMSSFKIPYEKNSIFNSNDTTDFTTLIDALKKKKEESVLSNEDFMNSAKANTENILRCFLTTANATKSYTVIFK